MCCVCCAVDSVCEGEVVDFYYSAVPVPVSKLGGHMFEKGIFSVLYKHKLPRIFIGFSKVLKYVNF